MEWYEKVENVETQENNLSVKGKKNIFAAARVIKNFATRWIGNTFFFFLGLVICM